MWPQQSSSLHRCRHTYPRTTGRTTVNTLVAACSMYRRRRSTAAKLLPLPSNAAHRRCPGQAAAASTDAGCAVAAAVQARWCDYLATSAPGPYNSSCCHVWCGDTAHMPLGVDLMSASCSCSGMYCAMMARTSCGRPINRPSSSQHVMLKCRCPLALMSAAEHDAKVQMPAGTLLGLLSSYCCMQTAAV